MAQTAEDHRNGGPKIKVVVVGAGISGLAVANGLINDAADRFDIHIYERDTMAFDSERGGYQIRMTANGLKGLKTVADEEIWSSMREAWASNHSRAPALVEPKGWKVCLDLAKFTAYPTSRPISRIGLRRALLQRPMAQNRVHFSHKFERFERASNENQGLVVYFEQGNSVNADILIAADGSNSQINRFVGLNNKTKLDGWTLIQSQGDIDVATRNKLPESLITHGSTLFLGGKATSGFVSIYDSTPQEEGPKESWNLFWSVLIPSSIGGSIIAEAGDDHDILIGLLGEYFSKDLHYGNILSTIISSTTNRLRTGRLTSSVRPTTDWRKGVLANSRIILLGDAVHPMTPGRGQGANQALTDAGNLIQFFRNTQFTAGAALEEELATMVKQFDEEMYPRAFDMVKKSEMMTDVDLTALSGRVLLRTVGVVLTIVGWGMSLLEVMGLKEAEKMDITSWTS